MPVLRQLPLPADPLAEWLEADGLGGYASGCARGPRSRRYHALLLCALAPPTGRHVLVNGFDAWVQTAAGQFAISSHRFAASEGRSEGEERPDGARRLVSFTSEPWPLWRFRLEDGTEIEQEIFVPHEIPAVVLLWRRGESPGGPAYLTLRPHLTGRDYHTVVGRDSHPFRLGMESNIVTHGVTWRPSASGQPGHALPPITALANAAYRHDPQWICGVEYEMERRRGLDYVEDLVSPGIFEWNLGESTASLILVADGLPGSDAIRRDAPPLEEVERLRLREFERRRAFSTPIHRAADAYFVRRGRGKTIVAGYPWFTDWGRDTFIAMRGLCLAQNRLADARAILLEWAGAISEGMVPNRFPDTGETPEFNSVDASLWYIVAAHEYLLAAANRPSAPEPDPEEFESDRQILHAAIEKILAGYSAGTRHGIRADSDGLLAAGAPGTQLTWMDAKVGDWVVTPRIGKPVEIQALWINALRVGTQISARWEDLLARARESFAARFWNEERGCLYDVVDVDHVAGRVDPAIRPNQIFAVGGLPFPVLPIYSDERARRVVDLVEERLLTPLGLRSLAPQEPGYCPHYDGDMRHRDGAYHQGTVWPWLIGPFVEAWVRVRSSTAVARRQARERFLPPLRAHLQSAGIGHISEVTDAEPPHTPCGCPFQAWSMGEFLRLEHRVLRKSGPWPDTQPGKKAQMWPKEEEIR